MQDNGFFKGKVRQGKAKQGLWEGKFCGSSRQDRQGQGYGKARAMLLQGKSMVMERQGKASAVAKQVKARQVNC
jgi:hypothetical protein